MKTVKKLLAVAILLSAQVQAREFTWLQDIYQEYNQIYMSLGQDNNSIESIYYAHDELEAVKKELAIQNITIKELPENKAFNLTKKCLFLKEGAYGNHLSQMDQNFLTRRFFQSLKDDFIVSPYLYLVEGIDLEIFNNKCAILMLAPLNHEIIILQGTSVD